MPKRVFWPAVLVIMGLILMANNMGYLPTQFWSFWPMMLIIVGLGGLLTSDRDEWIVPTNSSRKTSGSKSKVATKTKTKAKSRR